MIVNVSGCVRPHPTRPHPHLREDARVGLHKHVQLFCRFSPMCVNNCNFVCRKTGIHRSMNPRIVFCIFFNWSCVAPSPSSLPAVPLVLLQCECFGCLPVTLNRPKLYIFIVAGALVFTYSASSPRHRHSDNIQPPLKGAYYL